MKTNRAATLELKVSLLSKGISFDRQLFENYPAEFYDNQFVYGQTSRDAAPKRRFPQVLLLGDGVNVALLRREDSPWTLRLDEGQFKIYNGANFVRTVDLPEKPSYFGKILSDGTPSENIIAVAGEDTPGFFLYPDCYYFQEGNPCGFCSLKGTRNTVGKHMVSTFTLESITEATKLFANTPWRPITLISITMGTCRTDDETRAQVIEPIRAMADALPTKIPIHLLAHPPNDLCLVEEFKAAGITSIAFNLEVYNRTLFAKICPGKQQGYDYDQWWKALEHARDVFGEYQAYCGLVWGLEPPESTMRGNEEILQRGIGIASNIFHADEKSVLKHHPQPSTEDILAIARHESQLYASHQQVGTIFSVSMRSTIDWELHRGDLR